MTCAIPGCASPGGADAPLPLCDEHLAEASEWHDRSRGVEDLLPSPCVACGSRVGIRFPSGWLCSTCEWRYGDVVDDDLAPPRVDVVYYLRQGDRVKIGTSANPRSRFAAIRHEEVMAFERGDRRLERARHERFAEFRFEGSEWFRFGEPIREHVDVLAGGRDPWDVYACWLSAAAAT